MTRRRFGFTLIELLIVIAIIGILIASIAVAVTKAKEFANNMDQKNNMKNIIQAVLLAETQNNGRMPPAVGTYGAPFNNAGKKFDTRFFVHLLPYLENKTLYDGLANANESGNLATFAAAHPVRVYHSAMDPSLPSPAKNYMSFVANIRVIQSKGASQPFNKAFVSSNTPADNGGVPGSEYLPDGQSNIIFLGTRYALCFDQKGSMYNSYFNGPSYEFGPYFGAGSYAGNPAPYIPTQAEPFSNPYPPYQISPPLSASGDKFCNNDMTMFGHSFGNQGMAVALGDTSVRNLSTTLTGETYARALHASDGQALNSDW